MWCTCDMTWVNFYELIESEGLWYHHPYSHVWLTKHFVMDYSSQLSLFTQYSFHKHIRCLPYVWFCAIQQGFGWAGGGHGPCPPGAHKPCEADLASFTYFLRWKKWGLDNVSKWLVQNWHIENIRPTLNCSLTGGWRVEEQLFSLEL